MDPRFVIARTASRRPTLQHRVAEGGAGRTVCGLDIRPWSRAYQEAPISQIICKRCEKEPQR